jgi:hypothetical protein
VITDIQITGKIRYNLVLDMLLGLEIELKLKKRNVLFELSETYETEKSKFLDKGMWSIYKWELNSLLEMIEKREREVRAALSIYKN